MKLLHVFCITNLVNTELSTIQDTNAWDLAKVLKIKTKKQKIIGKCIQISFQMHESHTDCLRVGTIVDLSNMIWTSTVKYTFNNIKQPFFSWVPWCGDNMMYIFIFVFIHVCSKLTYQFSVWIAFQHWKILENVKTWKNCSSEKIKLKTWQKSAIWKRFQTWETYGWQITHVTRQKITDIQCSKLFQTYKS